MILRTQRIDFRKSSNLTGGSLNPYSGSYPDTKHRKWLIDRSCKIDGFGWSVSVSNSFLWRETGILWRDERTIDIWSRRQRHYRNWTGVVSRREGGRRRWARRLGRWKISRQRSCLLRNVGNARVAVAIEIEFSRDRVAQNHRRAVLASPNFEHVVFFEL